MRTLFRLIERCSAPAISALVKAPADALAINSAHICDSEPPGGITGLMVTPQPCAQSTISRIV